MSEQKEEVKKEKERKKYSRYAGMAYELVGVMIVGAIAGHYLDKWAENETSYWTAGLLVFLLVSYFIKLYYALIKE